MHRLNKFALIGFLLAVSPGCAVYNGAKNGLARFFGNDDSSRKVEIVKEGHGSGAVIHEDGYILTNHHVAGNPKSKLRITIVEGGGKPLDYDARLIAADASVDLAVIKIERRFDSPVEIARAEDVEVGEMVYNIGYPYNFGKAVTRGSITNRKHDGDSKDPSWKSIMLVDIMDGHGTSGSGIFSQRTGKLVGIMMGYLGAGARSGTYPRAVIPVEKIRAFLDKNHIPYHGASSAPKGWAVPVSQESWNPPHVIGIPLE